MTHTHAKKQRIGVPQHTAHRKHSGTFWEATLSLQFGGRDLTSREKEVITLAFTGKTDKEIAQTLGSSPRTVHHQLESIYRKLGVRTRTEAIHRMLSLPDQPSASAETKNENEII